MAIEQFLDQLESARQALPAGRPVVTLAYAQSLDGSIARVRGAPSAISGEESLRLTHRLRAAHDAILIGAGTLLSDDPRLTVRLVSGPQPRPVVLDPRLRFPRTARLLQSPACQPWIAAGDGLADPARAVDLEQRGARILWLPADTRGWLRLPALLARLRAEGISSLMVEGGARVLTSFLISGLADWAVVTVAPVFLGGLPVVDPGGAPFQPARLEGVQFEPVGQDLVLWGKITHAPERPVFS